LIATGRLRSSSWAREDLTEAALAQASEDRVTTDLLDIALRGATRSHNGRLLVFRFRQLFISSMARSLTTIDRFHDCQPEAIVSS